MEVLSCGKVLSMALVSLEQLLQSLNSLNQGMALADAKNSKEKWAKFFYAFHSNTVPVRSNACNKGFHQKCSTGPKASSHDDQRKHEKCTKLQQNRLAAFSNCQLSGPTNSTPSQPQPVAFRNKLTVSSQSS